MEQKQPSSTARDRQRRMRMSHVCTTPSLPAPKQIDVNVRLSRYCEHHSSQSYSRSQHMRLSLLKGSVSSFELYGPLSHQRIPLSASPPCSLTSYGQTHH